MSEMRNVQVPEQLCRAAESQFAHRFSSIGELLTELLTELLSQSAAAMDEHEQHVIEERLKSLGYI